MSQRRNSNYQAAERGIERYELASGAKRYRVRFTDFDGTHRSKSFSRLTDARSFHVEKRIEAETSDTTKRQASQPNLSLAEFAQATWMPEAKAERAAATWERDKIVYNKHVLHQLGPKRIAHIDAEDLLDWRNDLQAKGVGSATIIRALSILSSIFQAAQLRGKTTGVVTNPTRIIPKPRVKANRAVRVFPLAAVEMIRRFMLDHSVRIGEQSHEYAIQDAAFLSLMLQTGARPGEIMALKWTDIQRGHLVIDKSVDQRGIKTTKTGGSRRLEVLKPLEEDLDQLKQNKITNSPFVITRRNGEHWQVPDRNNWRRRHFATAAMKAETLWDVLASEDRLDDSWPESIAGITEATPYHLGRHTHSALMLSTGMPLIKLSAIQGHSIRTLSEVYAHELDAVDPDASPEIQITKARQEVADLFEEFSVDELTVEGRPASHRSLR